MRDFILSILVGVAMGIAWVVLHTTPTIHADEIVDPMPPIYYAGDGVVIAPILIVPIDGPETDAI